MVTSCCAYGCTYRYKKGSGIGIFRFPRDKIRCKAWVNATKRKNWEPNACSRICGKHFQTGKPSKDINHPDYVPNVFSFSRNKNTAEVYEKRKKNLETKKQKLKENDAASALLVLQSTSVVIDPVGEVGEITPVGPMGEINNEEVSSSDVINSLTIEINFLRQEKWRLQKEVEMLHPTKSILNNKANLLLCTGLPSKKLFDWILKVCEVDVNDNMTVDLETQLLVVLMKLKLNLLFMYLGVRFNISRTLVKRICAKWLPVLGSVLSSLIKWPNRKQLKKNLPQCFRTSKYKKTICIADCTEVEIQRPSNPEAQAQTWSNYKNAYTMKFLVGVTPNGHICFLSVPWGGRATDRDITLTSGFIDHVRPGDVVLADRGFVMNDYFQNKGAELIVPSFTRGKKQLSMDEVYYSKKVSNVRIHVERGIKLIKRFHVLKTKVPITFLEHVNDVVIICAALSNLGKAIVL